MKPEDFCLWLQIYLNPDNTFYNNINYRNIKQIKDKLNEVKLEKVD